MKRKLLILSSILMAVVCLCTQFFTQAEKRPFENLYKQGFGGYTTDEAQVATDEFFSSESVSVTAGETVYFGPCDRAQYFQLVGFNGDKAVTGKIRGKDLTVADTFENKTVIYSYTVPKGVDRLIFSCSADVEPVYVISKTALSNLVCRAYWKAEGINADPYVGEGGYYEITAGDRIYFGAITYEGAKSSTMYNSQGGKIGTFDVKSLTLTESFGGDYGIYCYTVPDSSNISYVYINYDISRIAYYKAFIIKSDETADEAELLERFIDSYGVKRVSNTTISALSGKSALFVGDSITYGSRDRANIYASGGWAGRIGYYCNMKVTNNGVPGACITTARIESGGTDHYIYNNLTKAKGR